MTIRKAHPRVCVCVCVCVCVRACVRMYLVYPVYSMNLHNVCFHCNFFVDNNSENSLQIDPLTFPSAAESITSSLITTDGREIGLVSTCDLSFLEGLAVPKELPRSHTPPERDTSSISKDVVVVDTPLLDTKGIIYISQ